MVFNRAKAIQTVSLGLLLSALATQAARIELQGRNVPESVVRSLAFARRNAKASPLERRQATEDLQSFMNLVFTSPIKLGGTEYNVIVDTASSDLWVDRSPETFEDSDYQVSLAYNYPSGKLNVNGSIEWAKLEFGDNYVVDDQAYVNVDEDFATATGTHGIMGLGLDRIPSSVEAAVSEAGGDDADTGGSVLSNLFAKNNDEKNYVTLNLRRAEGSTDQVPGGTVTISDVEPDYAAIKEQPKIPVHPAGSTRWTVLVDRVSIGGHHIALESAVKDTPAGKAVGLVSTDLAASSGYLPPKVFDELYSKFPEAVRYESAEGWVQYIVPCKAPGEVSITIHGHHYPLHPLDITEYWEKRPESLQEYAVCVSSLKCHAGTENWDLTIGNSFLRNTYTLYDFGDYPEGSDKLGDPYLQFWPKTNHSVSGSEFAAVRATNTLTELPPQEVLAILNGAAPPTPSNGNTDKHGNKHKTPHHNSGAKSADTSNTNVHLKTDGAKEGDADSSSSSSGSTWAKFMPAVIALLAVNLVVALVLMVLGILNYIKKSGSAKGGVPHYIPVSKGADGQHTIIFDSEAGGSKAGGYSSGTTRYGD